MNTPSILSRRAAVTATRLAVAAALTAALCSAQAAGTTPPELARVGAVLPLAQFRADDASALGMAARAGVLASLLAGSDVAPAAPDVAARALAASPTHAEFVVVRAANGGRALQEAAATPTTAAAKVAHAEQSGSDADIAARARAAAATAGGDAAGRIRVLLDARDHEALAVHGAVADDYLSDADIGPVQARAAFEATLQRLQADPATAARAAKASAADGVRTARLMQAERAVDGPVSTRVKAYLFEVPTTVGAIPVFGAETVVAVHRSGQLQSIRMTGPQAAPAAKQASIRRAVAAETLEKRARLDNPGATVVALGLQYPWQATDNAALAARPHEAFQVLPQARVDGATVDGRAHYVFYSVEDSRAAPLVWPTPRPDAVGDRR